jgi:hypothetical protein
MKKAYILKTLQEIGIEIFPECFCDCHKLKDKIEANCESCCGCGYECLLYIEKDGTINAIAYKRGLEFVNQL